MRTFFKLYSLFKKRDYDCPIFVLYHLNTYFSWRMSLSPIPDLPVQILIKFNIMTLHVLTSKFLDYIDNPISPSVLWSQPCSPEVNCINPCQIFFIAGHLSLP